MISRKLKTMRIHFLFSLLLKRNVTGLEKRIYKIVLWRSGDQEIRRSGDQEIRVAELRGSGEQEITLQGMKRLVGNGDKETMHLLMCADSRTDIPHPLPQKTTFITK